MSILTTKRLLYRAAHQFQRRRRKIPKEEIARRLKRLKALAEKKAPPVEVRRELIGLQRKLQGVFELEKELREEEKKEKKEIALLKKQIASLRKRIALAEDKDLQRKVDRIAFIVGDLMAKHETAREIEARKVIQQAIKREQEKVIPPPPARRLELLEQKLATVKAKKQLPPAEIKELERRIAALKERIQQEQGEIKHTMLFGAPQKEEQREPSEE
jgi:hypothetical protein